MRKATVVTLVNQKGGVGKTTSAINLAAAVALQGKKALLVDSDPQGNASSGLGIDVKGMGYHLYHCFIEESKVFQAIRPAMDNLNILPTHIDLVGIEVELINASRRERYMADMLEPLRGEYDYIFIDCPPSLGLLTINALTAADSVIIPLQCEYFALEGLSQLIRTVRLVKNSYNPKLTIEGILLTMFDRRNRLTYKVAKDVKKHFGRTVFNTVIPRNVRLSECPSFGKPILIYDPKSAGALAYNNLAREFIERREAAARARDAA